MEAKKAELSTRLDAFFNQYADPKWDIWHGGKSKAGKYKAEGDAPPQEGKAKAKKGKK
jgi:hypothetical protein